MDVSKFLEARDYAKSLARVGDRIQIHEFILIMKSKFLKHIDLLKPLGEESDKRELLREIDDIATVLELYATYDSTYCSRDRLNIIEALESENRHSYDTIKAYHDKGADSATNVHIIRLCSDINRNIDIIERIKSECSERVFRKPSMLG